MTQKVGHCHEMHLMFSTAVSHLMHLRCTPGAVFASLKVTRAMSTFSFRAYSFDKETKIDSRLQMCLFVKQNAFPLAVFLAFLILQPLWMEVVTKCDAFSKAAKVTRRLLHS